MAQNPDQAGSLIPQPELSLPALREAVARVAPARLPEMLEKMRAAFARCARGGDRCVARSPLPRR